MGFNWNWDVTIFVTFLAVNLIVGLFYSRKVNSIREYAIGNQKFSTSTIASTITATWIGGGVLSQTITETYKQGLYFIIPALGDSLVLAVIGYFLAPRLVEFLGQLSIAETMGNLYGKKVRIICAMIGIASCIGVVAVQFKVSATILKLFFDVSSFYAVFVSALIVITYSSFGGIKAVTFTDIIQFFTFATVIPIVSLIIWGTLSDPYKVFSTISAMPAFDYKQVVDFSNTKFLNSLLLFLFFIIPTLEPAIFQRITMAKNTLQITRSFIIASFACFGVSIIISWIGILLLAENPNLEPNNLLTHIIETYSYTGLKGFIAIGIIAIVMSTADSYINSAAVIFTNDLCNPLGIRINNKELMLSRISAVCIGILAFFLAFNTHSILKITLLIWGSYMPIITTPLLLAIFGFRSSSKSVLMGMSVGLIVIIIFKLFDLGIDSVIPAMLGNFLTLIGSHYLLKQKGGWVGIKDPSPLIAMRLERKRKFQRAIQLIKEFNLLEFCKSNLPRNEVTYSLFGFFVIAATYSSLYTISEETRVYYQGIYNFIYHSVLIISTGFLTYPIWPPTFKNEKFIAAAWSLGIFYLLICVGSMLVIISKFNQLQLMIFMLNLLITGILLRWQVTLFMAICGTFLSVQFFKWHMGTSSLTSDLRDTQFQIIYLLLLFSSALIAFLKPKQQQEEIAETYQEHLERKNISNQTNLLRAPQHKEEFFQRLDEQCIQSFKSLYQQLETFKNGVDNSANQGMSSKIEDLLQIAKRLKDGAEYLEVIISQVKNEIQIKPIKVNLEPFLFTLIDEYKKINFARSLQIDTVFHTQTKEIEIDESLIKKVVTAFLDYGLANTDDENIQIVFIDDRLEYDLDFTDALKAKRDALKISIIFKGVKLQQVDIDNLLNAESYTKESLIFSEMHKIILAHYGKVDISLQEPAELICSFTIPIRLKEIRPKKKDLPNASLETIKKLDIVLSQKGKETAIEIAKKLMEIGLSANNIAKVTGLSLKEINKLEV